METLVHYKILIIESDKTIWEMLQLHLNAERFSFLFAESGRDGLQLFCEQEPDIILVNVALPDTDGIMLCRELRDQQGKRLPFIFILSDQTASYCEVEAFRSGADDFINIPVNPEAFKMRLEAFIKRSVLTANLLGKPYIINFENLRIDTKHFLVYLNNKALDLTKKEVEILTFLVKNPDKVFTHEQIVQEVWKEAMANSYNNVSVRVHHIREKIGEGRIKTIKRGGYKFVPDFANSNYKDF